MNDVPTVRPDPGAAPGRVVVRRPPPPEIGLTLRPSHPVYDRIDRIEWNRLSGQVRVVTGTPGSALLPPVPDGWEGVALVRMPRGSVTVADHQVLPVTPAAPTPTSGVFRTGRKVGRTLYLQSGPEPSDEDDLVGMLDTPELAALAADAINAVLASRRAGGEVDG